MPPKGDVSDWIAAGGKADALDRLADATPVFDGGPKPPAGPGDEPAPGVAGLQWVQRNDEGAPIANLANALSALRTAPELVNLLAYDEMLRVPLLMAPMPGCKGGWSKPRPVSDVDITALQEWLQLAGLRRIGQDTVHIAVDKRAMECRFHPVRDYLGSLKWDGTPRLATWLHTYLGAETTPYTARIGTMFMVAMVARVMHPGCKADYALVLEGEQGARKSAACAIIGGEWFSDALPDIRTGKDAAAHLNGRWLIEIAEMSALDKAEAAALKAFITRRDERYRPAYGRREVHEPRQCLFIGTTNKATYLRDETGARRFWPVKVGTIDTDALQRHRDLLFAEAASRYASGARWWPDAAFEAEHIKPEQDARYESDAWEDAIGGFLALRPRVTVLEVAREGLFIDTPKIGTADQRRISAALERLGWTRKRSNGVTSWIPALRS